MFEKSKNRIRGVRDPRGRFAGFCAAKCPESISDVRRHLFETLFDSMREMVVLHEIVYDNNHNPINYRLIGCNDAFTRMTGIKKENAIGKLATEVYNTTPPPYFEEFLKVVKTGQPYEYSTYFPPLDKYFAVSVISPGKDHFATVTNDITASRQLQDMLSARNKELENYLYVTSHDLRSPLVNIQGFSQRLQKQVNAIKTQLAPFQEAYEANAEFKQLLEEAIPKTLGFITSGVNKMDVLLSGLLQLSRTGRAPLRVKLVDMKKLFESIVAAHNYQLNEVSASVAIDELPNCYGDEILLNQLFSNIINNAIKYRDPGRPLKLEIKAISGFKKVIYSIKDNGLGINKENKDKVWNLFFRADAPTAIAGEGLGLSIVKKIAEKHRGKVWVETEAGFGSVFFVVLQTTEFQEF